MTDRARVCREQCQASKRDTSVGDVEIANRPVRMSGESLVIAADADTAMTGFGTPFVTVRNTAVPRRNVLLAWGQSPEAYRFLNVSGIPPCALFVFPVMALPSGDS